VRDENGQPSFLQGVAFDITKIKEAEEERDRFFLLAIDLFCVAGMDGYFKRVNPAFTSTLGFGEQELLSSPFLEFVHPEDREATQAEVDKLAEGGATFTFENRFRCKDGSYKWLQWTAAPYLDQQVMYAAARDITEQKNYKEELERRVVERTEELQAKTEELEHFARAASHDLKKSIYQLQNHPTVLRDRYKGRLDAAADEALDDTIAAAERLKTLVESLEQYATAVEYRVCVPTDALASARQARTLQTDIPEIGEVRIDDNKPMVMGDGVQLMFLFQNLISNAIKYRDPDRDLLVEVGAQRQQDDWLFWVRDNGVGIEQRFIRKLFVEWSKGARVHQNWKKIPGNGYGLQICKTIVTRHGGKIRVVSEFGVGSSFYFTLPAVPCSE
jgi:PAS domain S-box-containing protein